MTEHECTDGSCAVDFTEESHEPTSFWQKEYLIPAFCFIFLILGIGFDYFNLAFFKAPLNFMWFAAIYLVIASPIVIKAVKQLLKGDLYNEFALMSIATIGAFALGAYAEGVAVMLFYVVGELFQEAAVNKAKSSIEALLKVQVDEVTLLENNQPVIKHPKDIKIGQIIQVKAGEKVALDGELISPQASLNTAALTGESMPNELQQGDELLAGMINLNQVIEVKVSRLYKDSKLSKILQMVQEAVGRKAKTQLLISRLARVYTPIVFWLAIALVVIPALVLGDAYVFQTWFQRALIFLVISCPCALVISIPLGYFGGIGAASKNGLLFKGSNFLDLMTQVDTIVMDKTGTLTKGIFEVQKVVSQDIDEQQLLQLTALLEQQSSHPVAQAIVHYVDLVPSSLDISDVEEISGHGMKGKINGKTVLAGNTKLLKKFEINFDESLKEMTETLVVVAIDNQYAGYISIADSLKDDAQQAINALKAKSQIKNIVMLSGDNQQVIDKISQQLGINQAFGGLLPEDKIHAVEKLKQAGHKIAFIGDGINDAPVITLADVGLAMGGLGSDAAIETADVIIQTDQPSKIATAIEIGQATKKIIWQNIGLALGVKILVLILGAMGMTTLWEAVIADVGVALLAILNAVRIQRMTF